MTKTPAAVGYVRESPDTDPAGLGHIDWQTINVAVCRSLCPHVWAISSVNLRAQLKIIYNRWKHAVYSFESESVFGMESLNRK